MEQPNESVDVVLYISELGCYPIPVMPAHFNVGLLLNSHLGVFFAADDFEGLVALLVELLLVSHALQNFGDKPQGCFQAHFD